MSAAAIRHVVCRLDELELGRPVRVVVGERPICVVRCGEGVRAIDDTCSHEDYSLAEGEVDAGACEIECWKHGSLFSLVTGEALTLPATQPVTVHPVEVEGDEVVVVVTP
jgi:3-phenylpropionate/trans-cinnamate dioxygenase ferredoxin subunit